MAGSGEDQAIDYSLGRLRRPWTTLWIVIVAAYHRSLSLPPPAIDYSLDRLRHCLPSTTLWIVHFRRCQPLTTLSIAACNLVRHGTRTERK